jgi:hypothetical protein
MTVNGSESWTHFLKLFFQVSQTQTFPNSDFERALLPPKKHYFTEKKNYAALPKKGFVLTLFSDFFPSKILGETSNS